MPVDKCQTSFNNIRNPICDSDTGAIIRAFISAEQFTGTYAYMLEEDNWLTQMYVEGLGRVYAIDFNMVELSIGEPTMLEQNNLDKSKKIKDGSYVLNCTLWNANNYSLKTLKTFDQQDVYVAFATVKEGVFMETDYTNASFMAVTMSVSNFQPADKAGTTAIKVQFNISNPTTAFNYVLKPDDFGTVNSVATNWKPSLLEGVRDLVIKVAGTPSATTIVVDLFFAENETIECVSPTFVTADFTCLTAAGATQAVTAAQNATIKNRYTLSGTGLVTGTIALKSAEDMTTKGFETPIPATVTIA